jgi:hypothetical protein
MDDVSEPKSTVGDGSIHPMLTPIAVMLVYICVGAFGGCKKVIAGAS